MRRVCPVQAAWLGQALQSVWENLIGISGLPLRSWAGVQLELIRPWGQMTVSASGINREVRQIIARLRLVPVILEGGSDQVHLVVCSTPDEIG